MKQFVLGAIILGAACGKASEKPAPGQAVVSSSPAVRAETAVYTPTFSTKGGDVVAGTAFVARVSAGGKPLLLTAHHLFGEMGGLDREYTWQELPAFVTGVTATPVGSGAPVRAGAALPITGAIAFTQQHMGSDVAAFPVTGHENEPVLTFATTPPAEGAEVFLIAKLEGAPVGKLRYRGVVRVVEGGTIAFTLDDKGLKLRGSSGAPIVNAAGQVVGMNLASGEMDGETVGMGASADAVTKLVAAAVR